MRWQKKYVGLRRAHGYLLNHVYAWMAVHSQVTEQIFVIILRRNNLYSNEQKKEGNQSNCNGKIAAIAQHVHTFGL